MPHIFIVDDEPEILDVVRMALESEGHKVTLCQNGREAWSQISATRPDLIILDIMLPGVDGYSLQLQLAQEPMTCEIPVVIVTALEPARTLFEKSKNVVSFMAKPFRSEELINKVDHALGGVLAYA
ncbi:MAG: response regulator [Elusimicrobiota bacterium]